MTDPINEALALLKGLLEALQLTEGKRLCPFCGQQYIHADDCRLIKFISEHGRKRK